MSSQPEEVTLDPEDWDEMTALGHRMLDDAMEYLKTIREQRYLPLSEEAIRGVG